MKPWERDKSKTVKSDEFPWERYNASKPTSGDNNLQMNVPAGPGVAFNPNAVQQEQNTVNVVKQKQYNRWRLNQMRSMYPWYSTMFQGATETAMQPVMGGLEMLSRFAGADNVANRIGEQSDLVHRNTEDARTVAPISTTIGESLPYMASGPTATKGYFGAVNKLRPGWWSRHLSNPIPSSVIPGAVEGGILSWLNPHQNALGGAAMGAVGNLGGQYAAKYLSSAPVNLTPHNKYALSIADRWGIRMHPGAKSGHLGYMQLDQAFDKNPKYADALAPISMEQRGKITAKVLGTTGMKNAQYIEPGDFYRHRYGGINPATGKNERGYFKYHYAQLEKNATPVFDNKSQNDLIQLRDAYNSWVNGDKARNDPLIRDFENKFLDMASQDDGSGHIPIANWRTLRDDLKTKIRQFDDSRASKGIISGENAAKLDYMEGMLQTLRDMARRGSNDKEIIKKWDKINSQFAAYKFIQNHNIVDEGQVDYGKLFKALEANRPDLIARPRGVWGDMADAAILGRYIDKTMVPTLGAHNEVAQTLKNSGGILRNRNGKGIVGTIMKFGAQTPFIPDAAANMYNTFVPRQGLLRLPPQSMLWGGNIGSAAARAYGSLDFGPLMIDMENR